MHNLTNQKVMKEMERWKEMEWNDPMELRTSRIE